MPFTVKACPLKGLYEIEPRIFADSRGYFFESYNERDFAAAGIKAHFVQDNQSASVRGVLRGLHFQKRHPQAKLVRVLEGEVYDIAVDLRSDSPTFGRWHGVLLSAERQNQFYVGEGFAHGFLVLSERAVFAYKCTDFYHPEDEGGVLWNDEGLAINWPETGSPLLSEKDARLPPFDPSLPYFNSAGSWLGD